jgi:hypothetical protein
MQVQLRDVKLRSGDKNIWAIVNSEGHIGQFLTQCFENVHDADKEYGFFQQDGATANTRQ